jgi:hypothetical protein
MWILKNSKELLANPKAQNFSQINACNTKTYDFSTLYSTIPHEKLKSRLFDIIDYCFFNKNRKRKYSYLVISHQSTTLYKYCKVENTKDAGIFHRQYLCSCLWSGLPIICWNSHGYELCPFVSGPVFVFIWGGIHSKALTWDEKYLAVAFNSTFRYIDDVLPITNN